MSLFQKTRGGGATFRISGGAVATGDSCEFPERYKRKSTNPSTSFRRSGGNLSSLLSRDSMVHTEDYPIENYLSFFIFIVDNHLAAAPLLSKYCKGTDMLCRIHLTTACCCLRLKKTFPNPAFRLEMISSQKIHQIGDVKKTVRLFRIYGVKDRRRYIMIQIPE